MKRLLPGAIGLFGGLIGYAVCALLFWYIVFPFPYLVVVLTVLGVLCLAVSAVGALALVVGLVLLLDDKMHHPTEMH